MSTEINPTLNKVEDLFTSLIWNPTKEAAINALFVEFPWLNVPVIRQLTIFILNSYASKLLDKTRMIVDVGAVALINKEHSQTYQWASVKLAVLEKTNGLESKEYLDALAEAKIAMSNLTHFNG